MTRPNPGGRSDDSGPFNETSRPDGAEAPTPPTGFPAPTTGDDGGGQNLADVIRAEDLGDGAPAVFGAAEQDVPPGAPGEWPTLEYRGRAREEEHPRRGGMFDWLRRDEGNS